MTIDMTGWERLGPVGRDKLLTELPRGQAPEGIHFALKIKKAQWLEGKYGYRYHLDVVIRTIDMQTVLAGAVWKVYPSMLSGEIIEAIDCDINDDTWWLVRTVVNPNSKADPPRTKLHLIDTQQGLDAPSGPPKPAAAEDRTDAGSSVSDGSERGQAGAGGECIEYPDCGEEDPCVGPGNVDCYTPPPAEPSQSPYGRPHGQAGGEPVEPTGAQTTSTRATTPPPPAEPCPHPDSKIRNKRDEQGFVIGFYCKDCGERVG